MLTQGFRFLFCLVGYKYTDINEEDEDRPKNGQDADRLERSARGATWPAGFSGGPAPMSPRLDPQGPAVDRDLDVWRTDGIQGMAARSPGAAAGIGPSSTQAAMSWSACTVAAWLTWRQSGRGLPSAT